MAGTIFALVLALAAGAKGKIFSALSLVPYLGVRVLLLKLPYISALAIGTKAEFFFLRLLFGVRALLLLLFADGDRLLLIGLHGDLNLRSAFAKSQRLVLTLFGPRLIPRGLSRLQSLGVSLKPLVGIMVFRDHIPAALGDEKLLTLNQVVFACLIVDARGHATTPCVSKHEVD